MNIQVVKLEDIRPAEYNPRLDLKPADAEYKKIKKSIDDFGLVQPLVWNKTTGNLVGGHQRLKVLKASGETEVEVVVVELDEAREKALNLVLNKAQGDWDIPALKELLVSMDDGEFDMTLTGFDEKELEKLINYEKTGLDEDEFGKTTFEVVVECETEIDQQRVFEKLQAEGLSCRLMTL